MMNNDENCNKIVSYISDPLPLKTMAKRVGMLIVAKKGVMNMEKWNNVVNPMPLP